MLSNPREKPRRKRRRTCADEARRALLERQRQRRISNPAGKVALQLLVLLSAGLALLPPLPAPRFSFSRTRRSAVKADDDDLGPTARAMERGLDPAFYETSGSRLKPRPTWTRLVRDLKRPRAAAKARAELESRVPSAAREWLHAAIDTGEMWRLNNVGRHSASEAEVAVAALDASDAWKAAIAAEAVAAAAFRKTPGGDSGIQGGLKR